MKKKVFLMAFLAVLGCALAGCESSMAKLVRQNLSECAKVYYYGENENFYCTVSSGEREEAYFMDGRATGCVDYALVTVNFNQSKTDNVVLAEISVDEEVLQVELEQNKMSGSYMVDLERQLTGGEKISIKVVDEVLQLKCLSNEFGVDWRQTLEIASEEMAQVLSRKKVGGKLNCEIYLRVLDKKANDMDEIFWCVTILNVDDENFSIVISTVDGGVLAKSN